MLTVLMATHNGVTTLPDTLEACHRLRAPQEGWRLRIADDGSTDATAQLVESWAGRLPVELIRLARGGKSRALNAALEVALREDPSQLYVFTDDDVRPEPDWLLQFEAAACEHDGYAIFGGAIEPRWPYPPPSWILQRVPLGVAYGATACREGPVFPGLVWGANMAVRRNVFAAGHRFDEAVGPAAGRYAMGSETEFTRRLGRHGCRAWFCEHARVAHLVRPYQLEPAWILERAHRFGRGARIQEAPSAVPMLMGVPRWTFARMGREALGVVRAWLMRDRMRMFSHRWELAYFCGYLAQAWFRKSPRVVFTGMCGALGGMEMRMVQDARVLSGRGLDCLLAVPKFPGFERFAEASRRHGLATTVFDPPRFLEDWRWRHTRKLLACVGSLPRLCALRADLVHVAFCWTGYGASALWLAGRTGRPCVISVHNAFPQAPRHSWHALHYATAFRSVKGVYAVSQSALDHFLRLYRDVLPADARLAVIPNSVDTQRFLPCRARRGAARAGLNVAADALVLGSVARLAEQKRPFASVELLSALRPAFPGLILVFVGEGPLEDALRERVQVLGLADAVRFTGHVDNVEDILPAFDVHLLLSRNEGFGIATIEAMACEVPVIGTDVPGTADVLRDSAGGLLIPLGDRIALAEAVAALLTDPARRADMGRRGRLEVIENYSPALLEARVRAFYAGLVP